MTTTTTSYRKTKAGAWVVFGPASLVNVGQVLVTKRDGTTRTETVESVGKTFKCDGIDARYGYIAAQRFGQRGAELADVRASNRRRRIPACERCLHCGGNGSVEQELGTCEACGRDFDF